MDIKMVILLFLGLFKLNNIKSKNIPRNPKLCQKTWQGYFDLKPLVFKTYQEDQKITLPTFGKVFGKVILI